MSTSPLALLTGSLDDAIESLLRRMGRYHVADPLRAALAPHRGEAAAGAAARYRGVVAALENAVRAREPEALARYDAVVAEALGTMRAARPPGALAALHSLDHALYRNGEEIVDDPAFPEAQRLRVLDFLDRFNRHVGSYDRWMELCHGLLQRAEARGRRPVRVHDLAAGHGGFAVALKERLGGRVEVTASDVKEEYLELGRARARERGVDVRFVRVDATDLGALAAEGVDVLVCTQSLHHFPPGMVARMLGEAARAATTGVCFIDAERGLLAIAAMAPVAALYGRTWAVLHDTVVSLRRMFYEEELGLLGALAPGIPRGARVTTGRCPPGFAFVRVEIDGP